MPLHDSPTPALFLSRPNRFLVIAELAGEPVEAHLPDPGRLKELLRPGRRLWLTPASSPSRRTRWTVVLVESPDGTELVSVDTGLPNRLAGEALEAGALPEFAGWRLERREFPVGRSRLDFLLSREDGCRLALEVKSVTLVEEDGVARFPDAVTTRGARHVDELRELAGRPGWEAAILFILQRRDARAIEAAASIDPGFAAALARAREAGVRVYGRRCTVSLEGVTLGEPVEVW